VEGRARQTLYGEYNMAGIRFIGHSITFAFRDNARVLLFGLSPVLLFILSISFVFHGCYISEPDDDTDELFALYLLADTSITISFLPDIPLDLFVLAESPLISVSDIVMYEWSTHTVHLTESAEKRMADLSAPGRLKPYPFIVFASGERIYMGTIWPVYSSSMSQFPCIVLPSLTPYVIEKGWGPTDPRSDQRVYRSLKKSGKLRT
jgi:hypothetical protein